MSITIQPSRLFRVRFADTTVWQAFIVAPDAETAETIAMDNWDNGGTEGFTPEQKLDVVGDDCTIEATTAEEVQP